MNINRLTFLKQTGLAISLGLIPSINVFSKETANKPEKLKIVPKKLKKGDTIGLITPSGIISEKNLEDMVLKLNDLGYKTHYLPSILSEFGYLAGTDQERADEMMHMFENKDVDAILCARGGYGAIRLLALLDYELIKSNPKIFIGYSDITAIINTIYQQTGLVGYHGPVGISTFNDFSLDSFDSVLTKSENHYKFPYEREEESETDTDFDFYTITEGKAEGDLVGGNLSVLVSMIGSKFHPDFEGKIVFLEDIDEKTYKIDKMLTQLIQATNINKAAGLVLGIFKDCDKNDPPTFLLKELLFQLLQPLGIPAVYGFPFGHVKNKITLPVGIKAKLNANRKILKLKEKSVD